MKIDIGIKEQDRANVASELSGLLADSYTLYLKTHNFHWNVTGPMFQTLHVMFEQHYTELALAVDRFVGACMHQISIHAAQFECRRQVTGLLFGRFSARAQHHEGTQSQDD